jgi:hypothetical protein
MLSYPLPSQESLPLTGYEPGFRSQLVYLYILLIYISTSVIIYRENILVSDYISNIRPISGFQDYQLDIYY